VQHCLVGSEMCIRDRPWTVERNIDLRNWLFGFGAGIRIDSPEALRDEHRQKLETALAVYQSV
jgi:hypothetical protein